MKAIFDHFKNGFLGKVRVQNITVIFFHKNQFLDGIFVGRYPLGINLVKKLFFGIKFPLALVGTRIVHNACEHPANGNDRRNNNSNPFIHGFLPPSANFVFGHSIIPQEGAFYKLITKDVAA